MDLNWLEDVLILLEEKSMARASQRRHITQPAFSRRIKAFENWLGVDILNRKANSVELKPALIGNEKEIRALTNRIHELKIRISSFVDEHSTLTIATQHSLIFSAFPDMASLALETYPEINFRLKAGNRHESVAMFLREEASLLLCYEHKKYGNMPFDDSVMRFEWGQDRLVLVAGGMQRYRIQSDGYLPQTVPIIVYPEDRYFGEVLEKMNMPFSSRRNILNPVCETAFSAGIKEMVLRGMGVAWLPMSMVYKEIEKGDLVNLGRAYGHVDMTIACYAKRENKAAQKLYELWSELFSQPDL